MLSILGVGSAHPDTIITNSFLESLNSGLSSSSIAERLNIEERRSVLPLDYLKGTLNRDSFAALASSQATPTTLGVAASHIALKRAGIEAEAIGLTWAETATPLETTPSESQRICGKLGIRVDAYDVASPGASIPLFLDLLNSRRKESIPEYVLCVSSSTLTQRINYAAGEEGARFGDGAAAMILSTSKPGKLQVRQTYFETDLSCSNEGEINAFGHLSSANWEEAAELGVSKVLTELGKREKIDFKKVKFIAPQVSNRAIESLERRFSIPKENHWHNVKKYGNTAGASALSVLAMNWEKLRENDMIVIVTAGFGPGLGGAILTVGRI